MDLSELFNKLVDGDNPDNSILLSSPDEAIRLVQEFIDENYPNGFSEWPIELISLKTELEAFGYSVSTADSKPIVSFTGDDDDYIKDKSVRQQINVVEATLNDFIEKTKRGVHPAGAYSFDETIVSLLDRLVNSKSNAEYYEAFDEMARYAGMDRESLSNLIENAEDQELLFVQLASGIIHGVDTGHPSTYVGVNVNQDGLVNVDIYGTLSLSATPAPVINEEKISQKTIKPTR